MPVLTEGGRSSTVAQRGLRSAHYRSAAGHLLDVVADDENAEMDMPCAPHLFLLYWRNAATAIRTSTAYMNTATATAIWPSLTQAAGPTTRKATRSTQKQPPQPNDERTSAVPVMFP